MRERMHFLVSFFFNDTATSEIYTLSLHDALPILNRLVRAFARIEVRERDCGHLGRGPRDLRDDLERLRLADRKSTRLNSSHSSISYAVFCLKKKSNP